MSRGAPIVALSLLVLGCGVEGIVEIEIDLPVQPSGDPLLWNSFLQLSGDGAPMDAADAVGPRPLGAERRSLCVSAVTADTSIRELVTRVRFCRADAAPDCADDAPELRIVTEAPFYAGRRTYVRASLDALPMAGVVQERRVARCEVLGCSADVSTTGYCLGGDGQHLCEVDDSVDLPPLCTD